MVQVNMSHNRRRNAAKPDDLHSVEVMRHYRALPGLRRRNAAGLKFTIRQDGIDGVEISSDSVPLGNDAWQYVLGSLEPGDPKQVYRRRANERGTYGGWRWETTPEKLLKRNAAERDADHPIEVTRHYRSGPPGYLSPWQRAAGMGQNELFSTGIKLSTRAAEMRSQRNPGVTKATYRSGLKEATPAQLGKLARIGLRTGHTVTDIKADLKATGRFTAEQIARGIEQAREAEKRQNPRGGSEEYNGPLYDFFSIQIESSPYGGEVFYRDTYRLSDMDRIRRNVADMQSKGELPSGPLRFPIRDTRDGRYLRGKHVTIDVTQPYDKYNPRAAENAEYPYWWEDEKKRNPRRGTRRYMGSSGLTASARSFESPRVLLLRDLIESGEATPREISEYHRLIDTFNRRAFDVVETRHAKRGNPGKGKQQTRRLYETFSGKKARRENSVTAPTGTPANVAKLGTLRLIETADGRKWKFRGAGAPILAADHRHKLHVVGGSYRMNPTGAECGEIVRVEYETDKPHLGQTTPAIYFHALGEETGERPTLRIDGDGLMHIDGGAYSIEADGIHN